MPRQPRPLTDQDRAEWSSYVRHVTAFSGRDIPIAPAAAAPVPVLAKPSQSPFPAAKRTQRQGQLVTGEPPAGLDKSSWNRFRTGKLPAARTLDLHGRTAQSAFHILEHFLLAAHAEELRCVEIITGRGSGEHGGVIRRELPHWLNLPSLRPLVLAAANPHARNTGSTRILLRRKR
jgi:DNA-nicking Smr family endonuclease